jgi:hypothetical protein
MLIANKLYSDYIRKNKELIKLIFYYDKILFNMKVKENKMFK